MEKEILSDLSMFERAWDFAKIDSNSNYFKQFGGISNMNQVRTLREYYKGQPLRDGEFRDPDALDDEAGEKYIVITIDDTLGVSEDGKIDLIVDNTGHDVAITYVGADGVKFEISPDIRKNNAEMLKNLKFDVDMNPHDIAKLIAPKDLDALMREIRKNDTVAMRSTDDAKKRADAYDRDEERAQIKLGARDKAAAAREEEEKEAEIDEELKSNDSIPQDMYSEIYKICLENDLNPNDLKQSLTVEDPDTLISQIDNSRTQVRENGGEVTILRFRNKEVGSGADKIFMVQDGKLLRNDEKNDEKVSEIMEDHKGNGVKVQDFEDTRLQELEAELEKLRMEYEDKKAQIEQNVANIELTDTFTEEDRVNAGIRSIENLNNTYQAEVEAVCNKYCPPKTPESKAVEASAKEGMNQTTEQEATQSEQVEDDAKEHTWGPNDTSRKRLGL